MGREMKRAHVFGSWVGVAIMGVLVVHLDAAPRASAAQAWRKLPGVPAKPEPYQDGRPRYRLFAHAASGCLYCQAGDEAYGLAVQAGQSEWSKLPLEGSVELGVNAGGEVLARAKQDGSTVFHRLRGLEAEQIARCSLSESGPWYVDAVGRVWLQILDEGYWDKDLLVLEQDKEPQKIDIPAAPYRQRIRLPCEYKPGHVALFFRKSMVWATPKEIVVREPPRFASDGTGSGPLRLGKQFLISGGSNTTGTYVLDARQVDAAPRHLKFGWIWFWPVGSAPDGRALVMGYSSNKPSWYAADASGLVELEGADHVLRAGFRPPAYSYRPHVLQKVCFDSQNNGYLALEDGSLAIFEAKRARLLTSTAGLPLERLCDVALLGDELAMVDPQGQVALWDTSVPLTPMPREDFDRRGRWRLAGPCAVDAKGNMWAFIADFPGHLSRFDGKRWQHRQMELGGRKPHCLTVDDLGNLQVGYEWESEGSDLVTASGVESWTKRHAASDQDYLKAWKEAVRRGAKRFFDGSALRTRSWTNGRWIWLREGRALWDGEIEADYYDRPEYSSWWAEPDGTWYRYNEHRRDNGLGLMVYRQGRWRSATERPHQLILGPDGLQCEDTETPHKAAEGFLAVSWSPNGRLVAHAPGTVLLDEPKSAQVSWAIPLEGNEVYLPVASGGGWVGAYRCYHGVFLRPRQKGKIYEAPHGRFVLEQDNEDRVLTYHPHRDLQLTVQVEKTTAGWKLQPQVAGVPSGEEARFVVFVRGVPQADLQTADSLDFPEKTHVGADVQIWAVDTVGNVSPPAVVRLTRKPSPQALLPEDRKTRWTVLPRLIQGMGARYERRGGLAVGGDGTVFLTRVFERESQSTVLALPPGGSGWSHVPRGYLESSVRLSAHPDGRVFGFGEHVSDSFEFPAYDVSLAGMRLVTRLYDDRGDRARYGWDDCDNLWCLGLRWIGRFDGSAWAQWERPVGYKGSIVPAPGGRAFIFCEGHFWICENGKLGKRHTLPEDRIAQPYGFPLGKRHVALPCDSFFRWYLYDLVQGSLDIERFRHATIVWGDGQGNVIVFEEGKRLLKRISGDDLSEQTAPFPFDGTPSGSCYSVHGTDCLVTRRGTVLFLGREDGIFTWTPDGTVQNHDWRCGIPAGQTSAAQEAPDGRVWILRAGRVVVFDPEGDPKLDPHPFSGWREIPTAARACPGFDQTVWYWKHKDDVVVRTDGQQESTWKVTRQRRDLRPKIEVISDQGQALVQGDPSQFSLLRQDGTVDAVESLQRGVLEMVQRGAKEFRTPVYSKYPPVVADDVKIYFDGKLFDGTEWRDTESGRALLDTTGRLMLMVEPDTRRPPDFYRFKATTLDEVEASDRFLLDAVGRRWYDPGLLEAEPGVYPIADWKEQQGHRQFHVALSPEGQWHAPVSDPLRAIPFGDGGFLIQSSYGKQYHLDREGLRELDPAEFPFGKYDGAVHRMARGRLAWIFGQSIFISPANVRETLRERP